jgi:hypothetical protein
MRLGVYLHYLVLLAAVLLPGQVHTQAQAPRSGVASVEGELQSLKKGTLCERRSAIFALHQKGIDAIPVLVSRVGDAELAEESANLLANPVISYRPPESQNDYFAGVLYAYVVELILAKTTLSTDLARCEFLLGSDDYAYSLGIIRKKGNRPIAASDLPRIKQLYLDWWESHRNSTLPQLQQDWKHSLRPLRRSEFRWQ